MKITHALIGLLLLVCFACDKSEKETPSGMKYKVLKEGTGEPAKTGEVLLFNFIFKDSKDSVWRSTYTAPFPEFYVIPDTSALKREDGMTQMLRFLKEGDSVTVSITILDFFKNYVRSQIPPQFDTTLVFTYQMKAEGIMPRDSFMVYQRDFYAKLTKAQAAKDEALIDEYLAKNNITAQKTESGLRYVITQPGKGENGKSGQYAKMGYVGYTLEGKYFDASDRAVAMEKGFYNPQRDQFAPYAPYDVTIDRSQVIMGWHEALKLMNKGSKATIYIPSGLAYGPQRKGDVIKENQVLVFDLEVIDLKDNVDLKDKKNEK